MIPIDVGKYSKSSDADQKFWWNDDGARDSSVSVSENVNSWKIPNYYREKAKSARQVLILTL